VAGNSRSAQIERVLISNGHVCSGEFGRGKIVIQVAQRDRVARGAERGSLACAIGGQGPALSNLASGSHIEVPTNSGRAQVERVLVGNGHVRASEFGRSKIVVHVAERNVVASSAERCGLASAIGYQGSALRDLPARSH